MNLDLTSKKQHLRREMARHYAFPNGGELMAMFS